MLCAENLQVCYDRAVALDGFDLSVEPGEILTLIGPNGSGKSTALRAMARLHPYSKGTVYLDGSLMKALKSRQVAKVLAFVAQAQALPPDMTVEDLVGRGRTPHHALFAGLSQSDRAAVDEALACTRLTDMRGRSIYALSGGERQRAYLAMALAQQPALLLLDEPTTYLDIGYQYEVLELIRDLNRNKGLTIVMVLHDINQAARYSDRLAVLKDGRLQAVGTPEEILTEDRIRQIYGMRVRILNEPATRCPYLIPIGIAREV
ncbi:MAG TPA: ABC transporter ATP-binding protein [Clostridia bacterium]|nr:ABC transporter ATP-binding protein [Clostridia bacterium]